MKQRKIRIFILLVSICLVFTITVRGASTMKIEPQLIHENNAIVVAEKLFEKDNYVYFAVEKSYNYLKEDAISNIIGIKKEKCNFYKDYTRYLIIGLNEVQPNSYFSIKDSGGMFPIDEKRNIIVLGYEEKIAYFYLYYDGDNNKIGEKRDINLEDFEKNMNEIFSEKDKIRRTFVENMYKGYSEKDIFTVEKEKVDEEFLYVKITKIYSKSTKGLSVGKTIKLNIDIVGNADKYDEFIISNKLSEKEDLLYINYNKYNITYGEIYAIEDGQIINNNSSVGSYNYIYFNPETDRCEYRLIDIEDFERNFKILNERVKKAKGSGCAKKETVYLEWII